MAVKTRPKPPTKAEQIEALQAEIEELKQRLADAYRRALDAEADARNSDPYRALQRQNEELMEIIRLQHGGKADALTNRPPENPKRGRPRKVSAEMLERVRQLRRDGASVRMISAAVGLSVGTVAGIVQGMPASDRPEE